MMCVRPFGIAVFLCLAVAPLSQGYAQGMFLEKGTSGVELSAGVFSHGDYYGAELSLGYSINGIIDLGISGGKARFDGNTPARYPLWPTLWPTSDEYRSATAVELAAYAAANATPIVYPRWAYGKYSGTTVSPSVTIHLLKQNRWMPLSLAITGAYEATNFYGSEAFLREVKSRGFSFGAMAYRSIALTKNLSATAELGLVRRSGTLDYYYFEPWNRAILAADCAPVLAHHADQETYREYSIGVHLSYRFPSGSTIHVGPGVTGNRSARRYGLSVGIAVPQSLVF